MATNTTPAQDQTIREAGKTDPIANLIGVIDDLDDQITAANDNLKAKDAQIADLEAEVADLENELRNA